MKFSVIIPTMWQSNKIEDIMTSFIDCQLIDEIIIINNKIENTPKFDFTNKKIKLLNQEKNIYVNPSWNLGVTVSKNERLLFVNDDVFIPNSCCLLEKFNTTSYDIIGLDYDGSFKIENFIIDDFSGVRQRPAKYFTWFFMKKNKFVKIPEDILIWCGDGIQFSHNYNRGIFKTPKIDFEMSVTSKTLPEYGWIVHHNDRPKYMEYCKKNCILQL